MSRIKRSFGEKTSVEILKIDVVKENSMMQDISDKP